MAKETGVSPKEIEAVQSIVMAVAGGQVRAQFREARRRLAAKLREDSGADRDE